MSPSGPCGPTGSWSGQGKGAFQQGCTWAWTIQTLNLRREPPGQFGTTHWSLVLQAGDSAAPEFQAALEQLCHAYWHPLYAFARRKVQSPEGAKDLTQAFFERFLERHYMKDVLREKGRF